MSDGVKSATVGEDEEDAETTQMRKIRDHHAAARTTDIVGAGDAIAMMTTRAEETAARGIAVRGIGARGIAVETARVTGDTEPEAATDKHDIMTTTNLSLLYFRNSSSMGEGA